jgi:hypothetical protein
VPTMAADNSSTNAATTAYVLGQISTTTPVALGTAAVGTATRFARADHVHTVPTRNQIDFGTTTLTYASTVTPDLSTGNIFKITLTGNVTLANPSSIQAGGHYTFVITQDATGGRTISFGTVYKFANRAAPTLSTTASYVDVLDCFSPDGTNLYCVLSPNFG